MPDTRRGNGRTRFSRRSARVGGCPAAALSLAAALLRQAARQPPGAQGQRGWLNRQRVRAVPAGDRIRARATAGADYFMKSILMIATGVVIAIVGAFWALQGFSVVGGSLMSGNSAFEVVGPVVALAGLGLVAAGLLRRRSAT
jgi:hypothetical protein